MHLAHGSVDPQKLVGFCGDFDETEVGYQNSTILSSPHMATVTKP